MNYSELWLKFYEDWLGAVSGRRTEGDMHRAKEFADKCVKSLKESDDIH